MIHGISTYKNPEGRVFGLLGEVCQTDEGKSYIKVLHDTMNIGWEMIGGTPPSPSMTPTPTLTPTISLTPTITPTASPTPSISFTPTPTATFLIDTQPPTATPTLTPTISVTPSISLTPTITPTVSPSISASPTPGVSATPTETPVTPTPTMTPTISFTPTISVSPTSTVTPTISFTPTMTVTPTISLSPTSTVTPTISLSPTSTVTPSVSITPSVTAQETPTPTPTLTPTPTFPFPLGLRGHYYDGTNTDTVANYWGTEVVPTINNAFYYNIVDPTVDVPNFIGNTAPYCRWQGPSAGDDFCDKWYGYYIATETGRYYFRFNSDDGYGYEIWTVDSGRNPVTNVVSNYGRWDDSVIANDEFFVDLTAGQTYLLIFRHTNRPFLGASFAVYAQTPSQHSISATPYLLNDPDNLSVALHVWYDPSVSWPAGNTQPITPYTCYDAQIYANGSGEYDMVWYNCAAIGDPHVLTQVSGSTTPNALVQTVCAQYIANIYSGTVVYGASCGGGGGGGVGSCNLYEIYGDSPDGHGQVEYVDCTTLQTEMFDSYGSSGQFLGTICADESSYSINVISGTYTLVGNC